MWSGGDQVLLSTHTLRRRMRFSLNDSIHPLPFQVSATSAVFREKSAEVRNLVTGLEERFGVQVIEVCGLVCGMPWG